MSTQVLDMAEELAALAVGLCQDADIGLEVAPGGWSWDPVRRVIRVSQEGLGQEGPEYCAGIIAHEVGHFFISRYLSFPLDFPSMRAARTLLNGIEDPRVDRWIVGRYPGAGPWQALAKVSEFDHGPGTPWFVQFVLECAVEGDRAFAPSANPLPAKIVEALDQTRDARRTYAHTQPPTDPDRPVEPGTARRYRDQVWPLVDLKWMPTRTEQRVQLSALEALDLAVRDIFPAAEALYLRDRSHLACWLAQHPARAGQGRRCLTEGQAGPLVGVAMRSPVTKRPVPPWAEQLAGQLLDQAAAGQVTAPMVVRAGRRRRADDAPFDTREWPPLHVVWAPSSDYDRAFAEVSDQVDALVQHLDEILRPQKRSSSRAGCPSGRRVELRRLMAFEADPRRYDELWIRTTIPDRRDTAFGLLVDLSGSMHGDKAHHALLGTVLLAETLHRLEVPFAIDGFQDVLIPLHAFNEPMERPTRQRISEIPQEVMGCRVGGNNVPRFNDDGPCLLEFSDKLQAYPAAERVLVVVSDGLPEGRRSSKADLSEAVRTLIGTEHLRLIGLGLGPNTDHVLQFYPEGVCNVAPERFADTIGQLVEDVLLGG